MHKHIVHTRLMDQICVVLNIESFFNLLVHQGSARQLFQRLQGPLEEDTLKAHFEKIILLGHQLRPCRSQVCFLVLLLLKFEHT